MMPNSSGHLDSAEKLPKRRACDECRNRKLACTKEPEGCARCKQDGLECHYSLQKPMGRPRKRRLIEGARSDPNDDRDAVAESSLTAGSQYVYVNPPRSTLDAVTAEHSVAKQHFQPDQLPLDSNLAFLDQMPACNGADLLNEPGQQHHYPYVEDLNQPGPHPTFSGPYSDMSRGGFDNGMDILDGIDFDDLVPNSFFETSKDISDSLHAYMAVDQSQGHPIPVEPILSNGSPSHSAVSPSANTTTSRDCDSSSYSAPSTVSTSSLTSVVCSCLSSLYLSLDALARLPSEVHSAMRVTRNATKVAHDIVFCPRCSLPLIENPLMPPTIQAVQNLMLLGALLPSACNAYAQILEMVDQNAAAAAKENRKIHFAFNEVGGLWGHDIVDTRPGGSTISRLDHTDLEPEVWRATIRAILRLDIYGTGREDEEVNDAPEMRRNRLGLKDVIKLLDKRHAKRHERMDQAFANGEKAPQQLGILTFPGQYQPVPPEQRNCVNILEPARLALKNLRIG